MGEVVVQEQVSAQGIKLFGKTIALPPISTRQAQLIKTEEQEQEAIKFNHGTTSEEEANDGCSSESTTTSTTTAAGDGHGDQNNNNNHHHGLNSRPDKIIACPRCKSMETKFCYFNNYNVNQPRHFCKGCQRYWTAGGALRNVPVGAGRRKAKPPGRLGSVLMDQNSCAMYDASSASTVMNNYHEQMVDRVVLEEYWAHQHMMAAARAGVSVGVGVYSCDFTAKRRRINGPNGPVDC